MDSTREAQSSLVKLPIRIVSFVFTILLKCMLEISKECTGHNYLLPETIDDAISNILASYPIILITSENTVQAPTIHFAMQQEVESIKKSLTKISMVSKKKEISFSDVGMVEEIKVSNKTLL